MKLRRYRLVSFVSTSYPPDTSGHEEELGSYFTKRGAIAGRQRQLNIDHGLAELREMGDPVRTLYIVR